MTSPTTIQISYDDFTTLLSCAALGALLHACARDPLSPLHQSLPGPLRARLLEIETPYTDPFIHVDAISVATQTSESLLGLIEPNQTLVIPPRLVRDIATSLEIQAQDIPF